jgi:hypothetical protein
MRRLLLLVLLPAFALAEENSLTELQGDERDACGAAMCLSSDEELPEECTPYMQRFSAIPSTQRRAFLDKCPVVIDAWNGRDELQSLLDRLSHE